MNLKSQISNLKFLSIGYLLVVVCLFLYSYTQVDLNLTLSQISLWQIIEKAFQYVGWFQRPLSTGIYLLVLLLLFTFYFLLLWMIKKNKVTRNQILPLILLTAGILLFSYNAFSYDLFNYMFDARIFTLYHENPYLHKALDYPGDPWINFMRWTHRTYPYGPAWLALTIPLSFLGSQIFLITLYLFKALVAGGFLGTTYFIGKIMEKVNPSKRLFAMAFFAFNPLVIIESLVSAHNDIVMMAFIFMGLYFLIDKKYFFAYLSLLFSFGIKFASKEIPTVGLYASSLFLLCGVFVFKFLPRLYSKISWEKLYIGGVAFMAIAVILASIRTELQPWYFVWVVPFVALVPQKKWLTIAAGIFSIGLLLHYAPFLYTGNWDPPIPTIKIWITATSLCLAVAVALTIKITQKT